MGWVFGMRRRSFQISFLSHVLGCAETEVLQKLESSVPMKSVIYIVPIYKN